MTDFGTKPKMNYDMGPGRNAKEIVKTSNVPAVPSMGTTYDPAKRNDATDSLGYKANFVGQTSFEAKEDVGVAEKCLDMQLGRGKWSASRTGGHLGDATNQPQSGSCYDDGGAGVKGYEKGN